MRYTTLFTSIFLSIHFLNAALATPSVAVNDRIWHPPVNDIRASVLHGSKIYAATDQGIRILNRADRIERTWSVSTGHLISDSVRDLFFYDGARDTWNRSAAGKSWGGGKDFPAQALIVSTDREVTVIDLALEQVYLRLKRGEKNALSDTMPPGYATPKSGVDSPKNRVDHFNRVFGPLTDPLWRVPEGIENDRLRPHQVVMAEGKLLVTLINDKVDLNAIEERAIDGNLGSKEEKENLVRLSTSGGIILFDFENDRVYTKLYAEHTVVVGVSGIVSPANPIYRWYRGGIGAANAGLGSDKVIEAVAGAMTWQWSWVQDIKVITGPTGRRFFMAVTKEGMSGDNFQINQDEDGRFLTGATLGGTAGSLGYDLEGSIRLIPKGTDTRLSTAFMKNPARIIEQAAVTSEGEVYVGQAKGKYGRPHDGIFQPQYHVGLQSIAVDEYIYHGSDVPGLAAENFIYGDHKGYVDFYSDSTSADVRAFMEGREPEMGGLPLWYQHGLARDDFGDVGPKVIEVVEGGSGLVPGGHRVFVGTTGGLTIIDESEGVLDYEAAVTSSPDLQSRGVVPWDRVHSAKYRTWSPRAISNAQIPTDRIDDIIVIDRDNIMIVQRGIGPEDQPSIAFLDFSGLNQERKDFYTHGPGIDEPLIVHTQNSPTEEVRSDFYLSDALGSITELVSKDGQINGELEYSSFGRITHSSGIGQDQIYQFTAREIEKETGLYYYRARYYNPRLGIFIKPDPFTIQLLDQVEKHPLSGFDGVLAQKEKTNLLLQSKLQSPYSYATNNPINFRDSFGSSSNLDVLLSGSITVLLFGAAVGLYADHVHESAEQIRDKNNKIENPFGEDQYELWKHMVVGCEIKQKHGNMWALMAGRVQDPDHDEGGEPAADYEATRWGATCPMDANAEAWAKEDNQKRYIEQLYKLYFNKEINLK